MKKRYFLKWTLPFAVGLALGGLGTVASAADATRIVVGADTTFPPFETQIDGEVTGFDIDMIKAIGAAENLQIELKTLPFNGIIPSLQSGALDVAVAGITITKERMANVNFSDAYYKSGLSVLVKKGSDIKGFDDLGGHVIATKKATSSVDYLQEHGFDMSKVKQFQNIDGAYQALATGGADAVLFDNPVNLNFINEQKGFAVVGDLLTGEYYGIAISKKKPELVDKINAGLAKIKADGTYAKLFDTYFQGDQHGVVEGSKAPDTVAAD